MELKGRIEEVPSSLEKIIVREQSGSTYGLRLTFDKQGLTVNYAPYEPKAAVGGLMTIPWDVLFQWHSRLHP